MDPITLKPSFQTATQTTTFLQKNQGEGEGCPHLRIAIGDVILLFRSLAGNFSRASLEIITPETEKVFFLERETPEFRRLMEQMRDYGIERIAQNGQTLTLRTSA